MKYQEIIQKLEENDISVKDFAFEVQPYDFENYPEALEAQKVRKEFRDLHQINYKWDSEENQLVYSNLPDEYKIIKKLYREKLGLEWDGIEQVGGKGEGDHWHSVKYFPKDDIYIKVVGYYSSYNGTDFYGGYKGCCYQVVPKKKEITVYE